MNKLYILRLVVSGIPAVRPLLLARTRFLLAEPAPYKTYEYYLSTLERMIRNLYNNNLGGEFIDIMSSLIQGQLTQAFQQAFEDEGFTDFTLPDYLQSALTQMIVSQYSFVDQYFRDIVDSRIDGTSIDPLLARAELWANRYNEAYNEAVRLITLNEGGNLEWVYGDDIEVHCDTCQNLNGIVARASEWDTLGVFPQGAPNSRLQCGGWRCGCTLSPTDKRRSPDAYGRIEEAVL